MNAKSTRLISIAVAFALVSISSIYFLWHLQNPELKNLESSLKFEAEQFNREFSGRHIAGGLKFGSALSQGDKFIIVIKDNDGIIHDREKEKIKSILTQSFCSFVMNIRNPFAWRAKFIYRFQNQKTNRNVDINFSRDYCVSLGYSSAAG